MTSVVPKSELKSWLDNEGRYSRLYDSFKTNAAFFILLDVAIVMNFVTAPVLLYIVERAGK